MKRVFALLCALALVLPMICTGAAAVESEEQPQEQYVFEKMPDIMYLDGPFEFPFDDFNDDGFMAFSCPNSMSSGFYSIEIIDTVNDLTVKVIEPVNIVFSPYEGPDMEPGLFFSELSSSYVFEDHQVSLSCFVFTLDPSIGSFSQIWFEEGLFDDDVVIVLTPVPAPDVITVDNSVFSSFSYLNLSLIILTSLGLSCGPTFFWFAYRVIKKKVSRAFFNGKL